MSNINKLYRRQLEDFQMDVASVVIVHLALEAISEKKREAYVAARKMGASLSDLADALTLDTAYSVTDDDATAHANYSDAGDEYVKRVNGALPNNWERKVRSCYNWRSVMKALFPKHPVNRPVPRPEPEVVLGFDGAKDDGPISTFTINQGGTVVQNVSVDLPREVIELLYGQGWDQMGVVAEEDEPGWSPGLTEPDDYDEDGKCDIPECSLCYPQDDEVAPVAWTPPKEFITDTPSGRVFMAPYGTPLDTPLTNPIWQEIGTVAADGLILSPEESDCGAPLVHNASVGKKCCTAVGCKCDIPNCHGCAKGIHWMEAQ